MPKRSATQVPTFDAYMPTIVEVLRDANEPLSNYDISRAVVARMGLSAEVLAIAHDPDRSDEPEAYYRIAWARSWLKKAGLLDNPTRGKWTLTPAGRATRTVDPDAVLQKVRAAYDSDSDLASIEIPENVADELLAIHAEVLAESRLPVGDALNACYLRFRERFGPDVLKRLDGEQLLTTMHGRRGNRDSLVYWLEFKNDDDFPAIFGSIAGGSALKFGIYQNTETGEWMKGAPRAQQRLSTEEAVTVVRSQRDQLVAGAEYLLSMARAPLKVDYAELENRMSALAPDVANSAWGHKYFALIAPEILDDYHAVFYQQYHLIKLHKMPSDGRYENAKFFSAIARQLEIPITHLGSILNRRHGSPCTYWRVGTSVGESGPNEWPRMRNGGFAAIGWSEVGSLADVEPSVDGKAQIRANVAKYFSGGASAVTPGRAAAITRAAGELFNFAAIAAPGDVIVAMKGKTVLGIGTITGGYSFVPNDGPFAHRRAVTWKSDEEWKMQHADAVLTTFKKLRQKANLLEIEQRLTLPSVTSPSVIPEDEQVPMGPLAGVVARIDEALRRKHQAILYGPPGTGKTHWALQAVNELAARAWFKASYADLSDARRRALVADGAVERCCFHPSYGYEDFIVGYRPTSTSGSLQYEATEGIFARLCKRAKADRDRPYYLIVDEINRGDVPRIFGELLTVLDKRDLEITVPLLDKFEIPRNVFIVGTMNTADRSIALLDAALRRRFAFIELMPDATTLANANVGGLALGPWLMALNDRILRSVGRDARNLQVGHAYFLNGTEPIRNADRFVEVLRDDIIPLLQEYCYENFDALARMLGETLVHRERQQLNHALFEPGRRSEVIEALAVAYPEISATKAATAADALDADEADDEGEAGEADA